MDLATIETDIRACSVERCSPRICNADGRIALKNHLS